MNIDAYLVVSNKRISKQGENKDEDIMTQMIEDMDIGDQESTCTNTGLEEVASHHTFL
jgi:hypothetical protein